MLIMLTEGAFGSQFRAHIGRASHPTPTTLTCNPSHPHVRRYCPSGRRSTWTQ